MARRARLDTAQPLYPGRAHTPVKIGSQSMAGQRVRGRGQLLIRRISARETLPQAPFTPLIARHTLCPPNPYDADSASSILAARPRLGT